MSFWLNTKRVARYGFAGFIRNGFVSLAAVLVMTLVMFVLSNILLSKAAMESTLEELKAEVDVAVYFKTDATEEGIQAIEASLKALPEVAQVIYVSREQALEEFRARHANDQLTMQALDELGDNPLGASLEIRAKETSQYEAISKYLETLQGNQSTEGQMIDKINFYQNKAAIDALTTIIASSQKNAAAKMSILALCSILIIFNTIRLTIYTSRDEIGVMNIVGAGSWYVRGPFMVAGVLYGAVSGIFVLLLLYPILYAYPVLVGLDATTELLFKSFDSFAYYTEHFIYFFSTLLLSGVALGALSSYLAVRRYLKI